MSAEKKIALYEDDTKRWGLIEADALLTLAKLPDACVDVVICDPPYGIGIIGERWDGADIRKVARRDGERLSAGEAFERWTSVWASEVKRVLKPGGHLVAFGAARTFHRLVSGVEDAGLEVRDQLLWLFAQGVPKSRLLADGLGTALKPAFEPIVLARAPITGTIAGNVERFGTGALGIDATRVSESGYWPANLTLSHAPGCGEDGCASECPARQLDSARPDLLPSRMFFCAKASKRERETGCEQLPQVQDVIFTNTSRQPRLRHNFHPTVKPIALMRWLVRLTCPSGGVVLDPFTGSGTTGIAAVMEGRLFVGIERESKYVDIACARLTHWAHQSVKEQA